MSTLTSPMPMSLSPESAPEAATGFDAAPQRLLGPADDPIAFYAIGGERFFVVEPPTGPARANIILSHGLTEHAGRHFQTARWLAGLGCRTFLLDLAGHGGYDPPADQTWPVYEALAGDGSSAGALARLKAVLDGGRVKADFTEIQFDTLARTAFETHFRQLDRLLQAIQDSRLAGPPLLLFGHSMGGLLCSETAWRWSRRGVDLAGVVLSSPAFRPQGRPDQWLENRLIDRVWQERAESFAPLRALVKGALRFNVPYDTTWSAPWISDLEIERELYRLDPLVPHQGPSSYASSIEDQMVRTVGRAEPFPVDALMLLPGEDGVTSVQGGLDFAAAMRAASGADRFSLLHYKEICAHDLLRSSVGAQARQSTAAWLEDRIL